MTKMQFELYLSEEFIGELQKRAKKENLAIQLYVERMLRLGILTKDMLEQSKLLLK